MTIIPVIAVDGPAASGKGTLCRKLADFYSLDLLDTGLLYRAAAVQCHEANIDLADADAVAGHVGTSKHINTDRGDLRHEAVGKIASKIAVYPALRQALFDYQRQFALKPPHGRGAILDGRDIGTQIVPETPYKFFLNARPEIRAKRRYDELQQSNHAADFNLILADVKARDHQDREREAAPLKPAAEALIIDTSVLSTNTVFLQVQKRLSEMGFPLHPQNTQNL